jgi:hypothetical protein
VPPEGPEDDVASRSRGDMGPGQVVVVLTEYLDCPCGDFEQAELPISLHPEAGAGIEGADPSHAFARRTFTSGGRSFDLWADFGSDPAPAALVDEVNGALATLQIEPTVMASARSGWVEHRDLQNQVSVETPQDWAFNEDPVPALLEPRVLFAAGTASIPQGGDCAPDEAVRRLPADGALFWIQEYATPHNPSDFPPRPGTFDLGPEGGPFECLGVSAHVILFTEQDRYFQVYVTFGPGAPQSVRQDVLDSLDSLVVGVAQGPYCGVIDPSSDRYGSRFDPLSGSPGDTITVSGPTLRGEDGRYTPATRVEVWWNASRLQAPIQGQMVASLPIEGLCRFRVTFAIPDVPPGEYPVTTVIYQPGEFGSFGTDTIHVTR